MGSPLGRYSDVAATIVGVGTVLVWLGVHTLILVLIVLGRPEPPPTAYQAVDYAGLLGLGIVLGQRATTNGASQIASATNLRLDAIGAPSTEAARVVIAAGNGNGSDTPPPAPSR